MNHKVKISEPLHEVREVKDLKEMLEGSVKLYGNNIAFKYREKEEIVDVTYKKLGEDVNAFGTSLLNLNLKDKKIAVIGGNSYRWGVSYFSIVCGLGVVVPIDKALPETEIENIVLKSEAEAIIFDEKYLEIMINLKKSKKGNLKQFICMGEANTDGILEFESLVKEGKEKIENGSTKYQDLEVDNKAMNMLLFTSGTTSASKAVMLSHTNLCSNIVSTSSVIEYREDDLILSFLPIHHTLECTVTFLKGIYSGSCLGICSGIKYILQDLVGYRASILVSVPLVIENMYKKISKQVEDSNNTITKEQVIASLGGKLRFALVGAAALSKEVILGMEDLGIHICHGYGLTETSPVLTAENDKYSNPGSIGYGVPGVELEVVEPDATGLGEIRCKGPNVMLGYYNNQQATDEVLKDGWFYTGDLGYVDENGFLFIAGRKKNVIVLKNGKNIFPEELELLLNNNPVVAESFVYSVTSKDGDQEVRAKIIYNQEAITATYGELSEEKIFEIMDAFRKEVNKALPLYKYIRKISVSVEPLIKTTTNKIKRAEELKKVLVNV